MILQNEFFQKVAQCGGHQLFWNGQLTKLFRCLSCGFELKSQSFRESRKPSRAAQWQWKWPAWTQPGRILSPEEQTAAQNRYHQQHGSDVEKPTQLDAYGRNVADSALARRRSATTKPEEIRPARKQKSAANPKVPPARPSSKHTA